MFMFHDSAACEKNADGCRVVVGVYIIELKFLIFHALWARKMMQQTPAHISIIKGINTRRQRGESQVFVFVVMSELLSYKANIKAI